MLRRWKAGQLAIEVHFLKKLELIPREERVKMINEQHVSLSIRKQSGLLMIHRSNLYYKHEGRVDESTLANEIHDIWLTASYWISSH